jgi:hypothetical protein
MRVFLASTPSSKDRRRFPSGERAIQATFFLFSYASVLDLLLPHQFDPWFTRRGDPLDEVKDGNSVSNR